MDHFWKTEIDMAVLLNCRTGCKLTPLPANGLMPFIGVSSRRQSGQLLFNVFLDAIAAFTTRALQRVVEVNRVR